MIKITRIEHIGIAVDNFEEAVKFYRDVFKLKDGEIEEVEEMKLRTIKFDVNGVNIELISPIEGEKVISKFLEKNGSGIHHIAFNVEDIVKSIEYLRSLNFKTIYPEYRKGAGGKKVNFLHPSQTFGVLIELCE